MESNTTKIDLIKLYTSAEGRVNRKVYWLYCYIPMAIITIPLVVSKTDNTFIIILSLIFLWPAICMQIKRWHDLNKSGWWVFIVLIPLLGGLYSFIMHCFIKGTKGSNKYGNDPLEN